MKTLSTARSGPHAGGCFAAICALALLSCAHAADWPQYRGANHDGASTESLFKSWPASLTQVWKTPLTAGFSSITIADGLAATQVTRDGMETLVVLDAKTGKELWARPMGIAKFDGGGESGAPDNNGGDGSRSTPTFDGGRVYALDAHLLL